MAWEAITKDEVAVISGVRTTDLRDEWYNMATAYIGRYAGIWNPGIPTAVAEVRDGNGAKRIQVLRPPVFAVSSVSIEGLGVPSAYLTYDAAGIYLKDHLSTNPHAGGWAFVRGVKNVSLSYTSGSNVVDKSVSLAIGLVVKELSNLSTAEGTNARIVTFRPGKSDATEDPLYEWGIQGKIKGIVADILGAKRRIL